MLKKLNTLETLLPELKEACGQAQTLEELRRAYISFKPRIDRLDQDRNEKARIIYWNNKHRITGDVLPS